MNKRSWFVLISLPNGFLNTNLYYNSNADTFRTYDSCCDCHSFSFQSTVLKKLATVKHSCRITFFPIIHFSVYLLDFFRKIYLFLFFSLKMNPSGNSIDFEFKNYPNSRLASSTSNSTVNFAPTNFNYNYRVQNSKHTVSDYSETNLVEWFENYESERDAVGWDDKLKLKRLPIYL